MKKTKLALIAVLLIGSYFSLDNYFYNSAIQEKLDAADQTQKNIIIKTGTSAKEIAEILEEKEIISSARTFRRYIEKSDLENKLLSGRFQLSANMMIPEITSVLTDPKKSQTVLVVPEGSSIRQIDERLEKSGLIKKGEFIQSTKQTNFYQQYSFLDKKKLQSLKNPLEGYLFPDTYFINAGSFSTERLARMMLDNFEKKTTSLLQGKNIHETISVASLLEKEVRTEKDLPVVSGIIWKRLENGWFLNIDAALLYEKNNNEITKDDLLGSSAYNTYKVKGLPPGPIGNPGLKTIQAALSPESSPYWFYLTKPETGEVVYAKTNDEQNRNRAKYLN